MAKSDSEEIQDAVNSMPAGELDEPGRRMERVQSAEARLRALQAHFKGDVDVIWLIHYRGQGYLQPAIMKCTGLSEKDYQAALQRLQRKLVEMRENDPER